MRSLLNTAAVVTAAIALGGCPNKRPQPVPGPQSAPALSAPTSSERDDDTRRTAGARSHYANEISWFQGTLEQTFSPTTCHGRRALFRYRAAGRCYNRRGWACSTAVSAGDSSTRCLRAETREVDGMNSGKPSGCDPMATLSRAAGTPAEGAETT